MTVSGTLRAEYDDGLRKVGIRPRPDCQQASIAYIQSTAQLENLPVSQFRSSAIAVIGVDRFKWRLSCCERTHTTALVSIEPFIEPLKADVMKDLGQMGESTFNLWCAQAGLTANGSRVDRTGWDFFVEFPFSVSADPTQIHAPALECKVQVKATSKTDRKLSIKLSNLRRLITAPMPAFFVFIEFDHKDVAQRAFLVHVDESIISKTLERIHELENVSRCFDHHKRSLTIHYGPENEIPTLTGEFLKRKLEEYVPSGMSAYVANKSKHLESTGFENGFAQITFSTDGKTNLTDLIDVSIGLKKSVQISRLEGFHIRFGVKSKHPIIDKEDGMLEMPDLKPTAIGTIRFREDRLSPGLVFPCRFYSSPLNSSIPNEFIKFRIEADFFDMSINPFTGAANYRMNAGAGVRLPVKQLRDAIRLVQTITASAKEILVDLSLAGMETMNFALGAKDQPFEHGKVLEALNAAQKIVDFFEVSESVDVSLEDIASHADSITQFQSLIDANLHVFQCDFSVQEVGYDPTKPTACISMTSAKIGRRVFGLIFVISGYVHTVDNERYSLLASNAKIEQKVISDDQGVILSEDLIQAFDVIEKIYSDDFEVITMFDKTIGKPTT